MPTITPRAVLKNAELEKTLVQDGIVTCDFLSTAELLKLKEIVRGLLQKGDSNDVYVKTTFLVTTFNNSSTFKSAIFEQINAFLEEKLRTFLDNYVPLAINIFDKNPDVGNGSVDIHQNPTFVQEPDYRSVSLWIPLQDVNINNGTLGVLRGSHEVLGRMRAGNMPDICTLIAKEFQEDWCEPIEIKGGQVAVLDDSIIHWSYPNK
jgi:ectoine hydroxylase-related dioxygenase (phytanoyl-CoA dioxygenase family)